MEVGNAFGHDTPKTLVAKPVVRSAIRWLGNNESEVFSFLEVGAREDIHAYVNHGSLWLTNGSERVLVETGDWLLRSPDGDVWPIANAIIEEQYEVRVPVEFREPGDHWRRQREEFEAMVRDKIEGAGGVEGAVGQDRPSDEPVENGNTGQEVGLAAPSFDGEGRLWLHLKVVDDQGVESQMLQWHLPVERRFADALDELKAVVLESVARSAIRCGRHV